MKQIRYSILLMTSVIFVSSRSPAKGLECYDSQSSEPDRTSTCDSDEMCYSEFYSMRSVDHLNAMFRRKNGQPNGHFTKRRRPFKPLSPLVYYYDRFCVHRDHCVHRGLEERRCLSESQLDPTVRRTFWAKLRSERLDRKRLVHSHFCCCASEDLCNRLGTEDLEARFNISILEHRRNLTPKTAVESPIELQQQQRLHHPIKHRKAINSAATRQQQIRLWQLTIVLLIPLALIPTTHGHLLLMHYK